MTRVAFYAPMKSPDHPNPSGDREIARSLMQALGLAGMTPQLVSQLRSHEKHGHPDAQDALCMQAEAEISDLIMQGRTAGWQLWVTYHNYYKAPDLLGPGVSKALKIPYIQIESTRARKRLTGPWARFAQIAEDASDHADVIFYFTQRDAGALKDHAPPDQRLVHLRPFLSIETLPAASTRNGPVLCAAMMRPGDKFASYELIAETLHATTSDWQLQIAGDGTCFDSVQALMAPFGHRVQFLGRLDKAGMKDAYARSSMFFWPGVNEAIGMVYLEAQAYGLPVLAQHRPGLIDVLHPGGHYPKPDGGAPALARQFDALLKRPTDAETLRTHIADHHLLPAAARTLAAALDPLLVSSS